MSRSFGKTKLLQYYSTRRSIHLDRGEILEVYSILLYQAFLFVSEIVVWGFAKSFSSRQMVLICLFAQFTHIHMEEYIHLIGGLTDLYCSNGWTSIVPVLVPSTWI